MFALIVHATLRILLATHAAPTHATIVQDARSVRISPPVVVHADPACTDSEASEREIRAEANSERSRKSQFRALLRQEAGK